MPVLTSRPPNLTFTSSMLIRSLELTAGWSRGRGAVSAGLLLACALSLDWFRAGPLNLSLPYYLVCAFSVWCLGERDGFIVSLFAAIAVAVLRHMQLSAHHPIAPAAELWNAIARTIQFGLFAVVVSGLKGVLALERWGASHDGLTGALNKAGFQRNVEATVARMQTLQGNLLFAYMDLDGFKGVNDQHGHSSGDLVLGAFADAARASIRPSDHFARIGGDEFAVLLALPAHADGGRVAELLHARLTRILGETGYDVTCSMGAVAVHHTHDVSAEELMSQADALMYEAKRAGKNTLRVARGSVFGTALHLVYPPTGGDELDELLQRVDRAERGQRSHLRRVA